MKVDKRTAGWGELKQMETITVDDKGEDAGIIRRDETEKRRRRTKRHQESLVRRCSYLNTIHFSCQGHFFGCFLFVFLFVSHFDLLSVFSFWFSSSCSLPSLFSQAFPLLQLCHIS
ncbi:hypothetical protein AMECASPLE_032755 [Ameca splendens]|uniref:Uncharacterized protein n=1 Tax=Ameca splendens TaxID=208324 RepID=A0ABV0ZFG2_9TELE